MTAGGIPLGEEDRAILDLECATVVGHTCHVAVLGPGPVDAPAIRDRIRARLAGAPELRYRLGGPPEHPEWVPVEAVDLSAHVLERRGDPLDEAALADFVADRFCQRLDRARPLWAIDVVPLADGGTALAWRVHHALADGTTFVRLARTVLFDEERTAHEPTPAPTPAAIAEDHTRRREQLRGFLRREFAAQTHRSPFDGPIGTRRAVAFADASVSGLHAAAHGVGATLNDAVLAVVAGGLRRWLEDHGAGVHELRGRVPVSLHHGGGGSLNRDSWFTLALPLDVADPLERLRAVHRATAVRKDAHDAERMDALVHRLAAASPALHRIVSALQASAREFAVSISDVVGSRGPASVLGRPVRSMRPVVEIGARHALRVGAMSTGDTLAFGVCVDPGVVEDVDRLAGRLGQEAARLVAASAVRAGGAGGPV